MTKRSAKQRADNPTWEDINLWRAVERIGLPYGKYEWIGEEKGDRRANYYLPCVIQLASGRKAGVEYILWQPSTPDKRTLNKVAEMAYHNKLRYCRDKGVPVLQVDRFTPSEVLEMKIRKWLAEL